MSSLTVLPPAPPGVVPYITGYSREQNITPPLTQHPSGHGLVFVDETPHDRDSFGVPWVRPSLLPKGRRGEPLLQEAVVHPFRQRRAMRDQLCQVCTRPPADPEGRLLFLMRDACRPIEEGERTASPPVCVPCAGISVQLCPRLRRHHVAAWVEHVPAWGVVGIVHDPMTLEPMGGDVEVAYDSPAARWVVAARLVSQLYGVEPADLEAEFARYGRDRLEAEFARVVELAA
ncbi:hypothetical protein [Streptomyces sp. NPDC056291]|uniref:hypothetical protein n=1 Tax=Streptomyces sp. NPDC056291 TaxID=3345772 RepID=UPI0035D85EAE